MAKWITLPDDPLKYHPYQDAFWTARRQRWCAACRHAFTVPPETGCPQCQGRGERVFHRLTVLSGRRGGKTRMGAIAGAEEACVPRTVGWACAPTNPKLHRYVIPAFQRVIPATWVKEWKSDLGDLWLKNGSLIHFQTLEDPDQGRGQGLDWLWIDEVCELTEAHWQVIRPSLTERRGVAFFTSSPRSYDWVYHQLYRPAVEGRPGYWACRYATAENPIISLAELEEAKRELSPTMYAQEYEASFVVFEGSVYGGLVDPQILRTAEDVRRFIPEWPAIDAWRQRIIGIDTGADHPFGALKLVATEAGLVIVDEYLERHRAFVEHAAAIRRLVDGPTRFAINKNERQAIIELAQHGIRCEPAENSQLAGIERVKSWLHTRRLWIAEERCPRTIEQLKGLRWAHTTTKDGQQGPERVFKLQDELPDCLRYALMTWPELPKAPPPPEQRPRDLSAFPPELRASVERLRRLEAEEPTPSTVGDFWA